jgi:hypothetical protein
LLIFEFEIVPNIKKAIINEIIPNTKKLKIYKAYILNLKLLFLKSTVSNNERFIKTNENTAAIAGEIIQDKTIIPSFRQLS